MGAPQPHARIRWSMAIADVGQAIGEAIYDYVRAVPDTDLKRLMLLSYPTSIRRCRCASRTSYGAIGNITTGGAYVIIGAGYTAYTFVPVGNKPTVMAKGWGASFGLGGGAESVGGVWSVHGL
jgi:hypothetical protein